MTWGNKHWKIRSFLANYIITINDMMKNYFPNKKNQKLIPIGVDTDYYKPKTIRSNKTSEIFKIVTVANLVPVKGIEVLINALNLMKDDSLKLKVVGDHENEYGKELIKLCRDLKLESQVEFTGKVVDVRPFIEEADLYVIPTIAKGEGFGVALVEAMCIGVPVLGSDVFGINYILKNYPELMFPAGNSEVLKDKLIYFKNMDKSKRVSLGDSLRAYSLKYFSMDGFITEHELLYKSLL